LELWAFRAFDTLNFTSRLLGPNRHLPFDPLWPLHLLGNRTLELRCPAFHTLRHLHLPLLRARHLSLPSAPIRLAAPSSGITPLRCLTLWRSSALGLAVAIAISVAVAATAALSAFLGECRASETKDQRKK
jgi:hypothetical protein